MATDSPVEELHVRGKKHVSKTVMFQDAISSSSLEDQNEEQIIKKSRKRRSIFDAKPLSSSFVE